jgi:hypothetical protein
MREPKLIVRDPVVLRLELAGIEETLVAADLA